MASAAASLIDLLQKLKLLKPAQLAELSALDGRPPAELAKELVRRGWLTTFQGRQILAGKADRLLFGFYVLIDQLGSGGSGHVFKARHQHMDRIVALKILRGDLMQDADAVGRFHREVEVLSQLTHPAIVRAFDAGMVGNSHFLAMEYVDGIDLERHVKESGPLSVEKACLFLRQVAEGLQYAHERGLVHRDIKPSNLLVSGGAVSGQAITTKKGPHPTHHSPLTTHQIKILDLGLARLREPTAESKTRNLTVLAGNSVMIGTPDYMAPEQALDFHTADIRADVYSLGCTFYFLLTGRPPYSGSLTMKLARHQLGEFPPIPALNSKPALAEVLRRMLAKKPEDRYQTPGEIVQALDRAAEGKSEPETACDAITTVDQPSGPPTRSRRPAWIAAGVALVLMLAGLGWSFLSGPGTLPPPLPRYALQFNGADQFVVLPDNLFRASPQLTVEVWFKASGPGGLLGYQQTAFPTVPGQYVPVLNISKDRILRGQFWDGSSEPPGKALEPGWHHVALVSDGQSHSLYLDGEPFAGRPSKVLQHLEMTKNQLGVCYTGGWPGGTGGWHFFAGQVAELRVWHIARTRDDLRRDRQRLWLADQRGLAAWYSMLEPSGEVLRDYSGRERHGQFGGGDPKRQPTWSIIPDAEAPTRRAW